jgi:hypothetical protein
VAAWLMVSLGGAAPGHLISEQARVQRFWYGWKM